MRATAICKVLLCLSLWNIASPEEEQGRNRNIKMDMILLCSLLRWMVKWSQGLTAPKTTTQLQKIP